MTRRAAAGLMLCAACGLVQAAIRDVPGFQGVRVWEATYELGMASFAADDPRLDQVLAGGALHGSQRDFGFFVGDENYDLFFSNANGTPNPLGNYLTIDGNCFVPYVCFNIVEVALVIQGVEVFANQTVRSVMGRDGSGDPGTQTFASDGNWATYTRLGDTIGLGDDARMSITLGFAGVVPEPGAAAMLAAGLAAGLAVPGLRRRMR